MPIGIARAPHERAAAFMEATVRFFTPRSDAHTRHGIHPWRISLATALLLTAIVPAARAVDYENVPLEEAGHYEFGQQARVTRLMSGDPIAYSNLTGFQAAGIRHGGSALQGTNTITKLIADDLTPVGNAGLPVTEITFSVANFNTFAVSVRPRIRFWYDNGGVPGLYYDSPPPAVGFSFNPITVNPGVTLLNGLLPPASMNMPGGTFWAGVTFDNNNGTTGMTAAQLDNMGQGFFDPPDVGTSQDFAFLTNAAGSFFTISNPPGGLFNVGGQPVTNFGWEFVVEKPVSTSSSSWGKIKSVYR